MEDLSADREDIRNKYRICSRRNCWCETILKVCLCGVSISSTGDVRFVETYLEFTWCLSCRTFCTRICRSVPFLWSDTTCTWFVVCEIVITTGCLFTIDDATLVFVIYATIYTVTTLTTFITFTGTIIVTDRGITCLSSIETFFLSSTVKFSFSTGSWDTAIFYGIPGRTSWTAGSDLGFGCFIAPSKKPVNI